ncbi:MAG: type II toxin-antitoxin system VapC family toxin [Bryobacteraceae bacterium]
MPTVKKSISARRRHTGRPSRQNVSGETEFVGIRYLESSAVCAALLERDAAARTSLRAPGRRVTSALTITEVGRSIVRAQVAGRLNQQQGRTAFLGLQTLVRRTEIISVTEVVLTRAGQPFPVEPVRTLDAIHLATLEAIGAPPALVTVVTRDIRVRENAMALGYAVE